MKCVAIPENLFRALGDYLLSRPMGEVRKLVEQIEKEAKPVELKEPEKPQESP